MSKLFQLAAGALLAVGVAFAGVNAADAPMKYKAALSTGEEVPPVAGSGKGSAELTLTGMELSWNISFEGLTGDAVAAHIHGPADKGANGGVIVSLGPMGQPMKSPIMGKATLTAAQIAELNAGKYYVNVHTVANKAGEIRGQIGK